MRKAGFLIRGSQVRVLPGVPWKLNDSLPRIRLDPSMLGRLYRSPRQVNDFGHDRRIKRIMHPEQLDAKPL